MGVYWFIKAIDNSIANEYQLDIYKEKYKLSPNKQRGEKKDLTKDDIPLARLPKLKSKETPSGLICFSDISDDHPAKQYLINRKIPNSEFSRLYLANKYRAWNSPLIKKKFNPEWGDHPRLVIPYYWFDGKIFRYTARAFGKESPRYQQTVIDEDKPRVFGLERLDISKLAYIMEGQIDSLFLPNALAVGSANYNIPILNTIPHRVYVPDNQPRNPEVIRQIGQVVDSGNPICIWNDNYGKDINEMVKSHNLSRNDLVNLISESTCSGIEAKLRFGKWRKC
jgi:hypothetical protein